MYRTAFQIAVAAAPAALPARGDPPVYLAIDLGRAPGYGYSTVAQAVNNSGVVVGSVQGSAVSAFVWTRDGGFSILPPPPGGGNVNVAMDINDAGVIVGWGGAGDAVNDQAWIYRNGQYTLLGTLTGYNGAKPMAINNLDEIVGLATRSGGYDSFYWSDATGIVDVTPESMAELYDINDAGLACGGRDFSSGGGVKIWNLRTGEAIDYGTLPEADNYGLGRGFNEAGELVGYSTDVQGSEHLHHGLFLSEGQSMLAIPGIPSNSSVARSINEHGVVVGNGITQSGSNGNAWVWHSDFGGMRLYDRVDNKLEFNGLRGAFSINDRGAIVCGADRSSGADPFRRSVLLVPIVPGDVDGDGDVDLADLALLLGAFGTCGGDVGFNGAADLDQSGCIELSDLTVVLANYGL